MSKFEISLSKNDLEYIAIRTFLNEGKSINWIALHYNCDWSTVRARIYENPELVEGNV